MQGITSADHDLQGEDITSELTSFSLDLLENLYTDDENLLISPLSVVSALGMTANGGAGYTLAQTEHALGTDTDSVNAYMSEYLRDIREKSSDEASVYSANSIWYKNDSALSVSEDFLQRVSDYYAPDVYASDFTERTVSEINAWIDEETSGLISGAPLDISDRHLMFIINALAFDALWETEYYDGSVREGVFTASDGTEQPAEFMHSNQLRYIKTENSVGFRQDYLGDDYSFVALLPDAEISDFIADLTAEDISIALEEKRSETVISALPKFSFDYEVKLTHALINLGMEDAFDPVSADFSPMAYSDFGNIFIDDVIHTTTIDVDQRGTRAGAVTGAGASVAEEPLDVKEVTLDRPFVFMIVDNERNFPLFIGVVNSISV